MEAGAELLVKQENIKALAEKYPKFMQWIAFITAQGPGVVCKMNIIYFPT
jgi:hypothetical protein